ncbi:MAG: patatin-like protein [Acidimicrobiia bacterium]|nr:patatin-like protein [Acidimicrobiia bacterium]
MSAPPANAPRELRFALAMNGGVSLAVWIGGVCDELLRLCVAGEAMAADGRLDGPADKGWSVYEQLCWAARAQPKVDVLTGASAGGMNGVFLALALVYGAPDLTGLRALWIDAGDFGELLRNPLDPHAPSLLRGDEYFLVKLQEAIGHLATGPPRRAAVAPIDLTLTATAMTGVDTVHSNTYGDPIHEREHAMRLRFVHRVGDRSPTDPSIDRVDPDVADVSDFVPVAALEGEDDRHARTRMIHRLARACRSTASFPGAFEPSRVSVAGPAGPTTSDPLDTLLPRQASFRGTMYLIDGGTLVNLPVDEAIDAVFEQPADAAVRRVFAMIVPDPGDPPGTATSTPPVPTLSQVIVSAASTLPRNQTVGRFLKKLDDRNDRVRTAQATRWALLDQPPATLLAISRRLFAAYRRSRGDSSTVVLGRHLDKAIELAAPTMSAAVRERWHAAITSVPVPWLPVTFAGTDAADLMGWGRTTVRRSAGRVLHLVRQLEPDVNPATAATEAERNGWRATATNAIHAMSSVALVDKDSNLFRTADLVGPVTGPEIAAELARLTATWRAERANVATALAALGAIVEEMRGKGLGRRAVDDGPDGGGLHLLLTLEVIETTFAGFGGIVEQQVERLRIDSIAASPLDDLQRETADGKVTGVQLGHFGAFLKASWRANDWMWGRLDGSFDLIDVVMHGVRPERLDALAGLHLAVLPPDDDARRAALITQLKCRRHAEIVWEETPNVVNAIREDREAGGFVDRSARALVSAWAQASAQVPDGDSRLDQARTLLRVNRVGSETIAAEAGSDLLTRVGVTAFAAATTVVHRSGPKVLAAPITALRYVALLAWAMLRATLGGPAGRTLAGVAFESAPPSSLSTSCWTSRSVP